jgi:hypothetical protein
VIVPVPRECTREPWGFMRACGGDAAQAERVSSVTDICHKGDYAHH